MRAPSPGCSGWSRRSAPACRRSRCWWIASKAETLHVSVSDVFATLSAYIGSSYVNQFNKFGRTFQVYVQADSRFRLHPDDILQLSTRSQDGNMVPLGALVRIEPTTGPALIGLYNLYPAATIVGAPAQGFSSGEAISLMEETADKVLPRGTGYRVDRHVVSGKGGGWADLPRVRPRAAAGLSVPGRSV